MTSYDLYFFFNFPKTGYVVEFLGFRSGVVEVLRSSAVWCRDAG